MLGIERDAGYRTDLDTLGLIKMPHAFCAFGWINFIDIGPQIDRLVRALGLAHIAVDAFIGDHQCHATSSAKVWVGFMG
jgi:hypothetical protein